VAGNPKARYSSRLCGKKPTGFSRRASRMGDFNSILDCPRAPKLGPLGKLIPTKATTAELRGEKLFYGNAGH